MIYALGRGLSAPDMPELRKIVRESASQNYRFTSLVFGIVDSAAFQKRIKAGDSDVIAARAAN